MISELTTPSPIMDNDGFFVHERIYREYVGEIPEDMEIMLQCNNPKCLDPSHMVLVQIKKVTFFEQYWKCRIEAQFTNKVKISKMQKREFAVNVLMEILDEKEILDPYTFSPIVDECSMICVDCDEDCSMNCIDYDEQIVFCLRDLNYNNSISRVREALKEERKGIRFVMEEDVRIVLGEVGMEERYAEIYLNQKKSKLIANGKV